MDIQIDIKKIEAELKINLQKGVVVLDRFMPGWRKEIEKPVRCTDSNLCILAQVTGYNFFQADLTKFGYDPKTAANYLDRSPPDDQKRVSSYLHGSPGNRPQAHDDAAFRANAADRIARQEWAARFGFGVGEKYTKNESGGGSLYVLRCAIDTLDDLSNAEVGRTA